MLNCCDEIRRYTVRTEIRNTLESNVSSGKECDFINHE